MQNKKPKSENPTKRKFMPVAILVLLAIISGGGVFYFLTVINQPDTTSSQVDANGNYRPPTDEEIAGGQNIKDAHQNTSPITDQSLFITDASQHGQNVEVRAHVKSVIQDGGTCTFTFMLDSEAVIKTTTGFADASYSSCTPLVVPVSQFPIPGTWSLFVTYASPETTAISLTQTLEVTK